MLWTVLESRKGVSGWFKKQMARCHKQMVGAVQMEKELGGATSNVLGSAIRNQGGCRTVQKANGSVPSASGRGCPKSKYEK